jgi:hypothetical protein
MRKGVIIGVYFHILFEIYENNILYSFPIITPHLREEIDQYPYIYHLGHHQI